MSVGLAPMEGVTNLPTRIWFWQTSQPATMGTPFLRVTSTFPLKTMPRDFAPELTELREFIPYKLVPQVMANDGDHVLRTASYCKDEYDFVELNCGCPAPVVVGKGAGSSILQDPELFHTTIDRLSTSLGPGKFAVKMRTGFNDSSRFSQLIDGVKSLPLARLTVHGRTRDDAYRGKARWDHIATASRLCSSAVIASGDIVDALSFTAGMQKATSVKGAIVGRGALRNPWIFSEIRSGKNVKISFKSLQSSLIAHTLLHDVFAKDLDEIRSDPPTEPRLFALIKSGALASPCGTNGEAWRGLVDTLCIKFYTINSWQDVRVSRVAMGKLKMLWNYLRSSLPPSFFAPELLRSQDLLAFVRQLEKCYEIFVDEGGANTDLELRYNPQYDWLYSGEKKNAGPTLLN